MEENELKRRGWSKEMRGEEEDGGMRERKKIRVYSISADIFKMAIFWLTEFGITPKYRPRLWLIPVHIGRYEPVSANILYHESYTMHLCVTV